MEINGGECTMGTMKFDEHKSGWQNVWVKKSPYEIKYSLHEMRIIDKSPNMIF